MNIGEYFTEDGLILNSDGKVLDIYYFVEEYSSKLKNNDMRFSGSFYELSDKELMQHYDNALFQV